MKTLIINNHTKHIAELENSFPGSVVISKEELVLTNIDDFDLIVLSGGFHVPTVINHNEKYLEEEKLIHSGKSVIGICLGCEMICKTFGGELEFMMEQEKGEKEFKVLDKSLQKKLGENNLKSYEAHSVHMTKVPEDFEIIVQSNHGPEMIKHCTKPIIGIQFHPEVGSSQILWQWLFEQEGFTSNT
jgi:GMP synthase (glutamine-hydrolysing)